MGPIGEPLVRDETGEGEGDCQVEKGLTNVGSGAVSLTFRHWDPLNCLCAGTGEGMVSHLIANLRNGGGWAGGTPCPEQGLLKAPILPRERMEAMEKQIASLTGLVQSALLRGSEPETPR